MNPDAQNMSVLLKLLEEKNGDEEISMIMGKLKTG